jgi:hypothetical protein
MTRVLTLLLLLIVSLPVIAANPAPAISQPLVPTSVAPGGSTFTLTVNGTGFVSGTVVNWNGSPRPTTFVSSSRVTAQISSVDIAQKGTNSVSVVNPGPGGGASNVAWFTVTAPTTGIALLRSGVGAPQGAYSVVTGDFNHDGKADTAILGSLRKQIALTVSGNLAIQTYNLGLGLPGGQPIQVAIGDFIGDGNPDLVAAAGPVWVLLGNGNGTFQTPVEYLATSLSGQVVVRDIDGDGTLDLVLGSQSQNGMNPVLLGNGDGTFRNGTSYAGGTHVVSLVSDDFNRDGLPDLAVVGDTNTAQVCIHFGNGDGTFRAGPCISIPLFGQVTSMAVADFNGDGKPDLAITPNTLALGNGDGTFTLSSLSGEASSFTAADLNGDGNVDLIFTNPHPLTGLNILLGNGTGQFSGPVTFTLPSSTHSTAVADLNGDGRLDIVGAKQGALDLQAPAVTLSTKALTFPSTKVGHQSAPKSVTVTNTGSADLVISSITTNNPEYLLSHDCPNVMEAGAFCTASLIFQPSIIGLDLAVLTIADNTAHGGSEKVNLHGRGK